jgi:hypothetical protein
MNSITNNSNNTRHRLKVKVENHVLKNTFWRTHGRIMKNELMTILLCLGLAAYFFNFWSTPALAKTAFSNASPSLIVNILNPDGTTTLVHEYAGEVAGFYSVYDSFQKKNVTYSYYSYPELESIATINYYSSIDAMPAAVGTKALGVTINALINDAQKYNPNIKWEPGRSLRMYPTDADSSPYQGNNFYNYDFVQGQARYYYPNLVEAYTQYRANDEDTSYLTHALDNPVPVEPVLCLASYQERYTTDAMLKAEEVGEYVFKPNDDPKDWRTITTPVTMDSRESFRFCMGLTPDEAEKGIAGTYSATNKFCRWTFRIDIGPVKGPSLTADSTNNIPGQPIDMAFPENENWRKAITGITIDGVKVDSSHYNRTIPGIITFDDKVFTTLGEHDLAISAEGYMNAKMVQSIQTGNEVKVSAVTLNKTRAGIAVGGTDQLTAAVAPANATNQSVTWSSSYDVVAAVSSTGLVTAKKIGTSVITVKTKDGGYTNTCVVTVTRAEDTGSTPDKTAAVIPVGSTAQLTPTIVPADAAPFTTSDLIISPARVLPGQTVNISAKVSNSGETAGEYAVVLKVNGIAEETRKTFIAAKDSPVVTFTVTRNEPGNYNVDVNGSAGSFSIQQLPPSTTPPAQTQEPVSNGRVMNWLIIGLALGGAAVIGTVGMIIFNKRRK